MGFDVKKPNNPERIYISRKDSQWGQIVNETEVIDFLSKFGFINVVLSFMSVSEQIALFSNAKVVIGPHGAGLTNIVFCQPKTKIIELFGENSVREHFYSISNVCHLEYYYLIGDRSKEDLFIEGVGPRENMIINLNSLSELMKLAGIY